MGIQVPRYTNSVSAARALGEVNPSSQELKLCQRCAQLWACKRAKYEHEG